MVCRGFQQYLISIKIFLKLLSLFSTFLLTSVDYGINTFLYSLLFSEETSKVNVTLFLF